MRTRCVRMVAVTPSASGNEIVWSSAHGAGGDGMSVERGDQGELVAARGAVAACECVGGLRKLVDALVLGLLAGSVLVELGKIRGVRHSPQGRT